MSLAGRTLRRLGLDRNPLRRPIDRVEAWIKIFLVVSFLLVLPGAAWNGGRLAYHAGLHNERLQQAQRFEVTAVLLANPGATAAAGVPSGQAAPPARGAIGFAGLRTLARWTAPDGGRHEGAVPADLDAKPGTTMQVWTDARGNLTERPQQRAQTYADAIGAATAVALGLAAVFFGIRLVVREAFDRRRLAIWQDAWVRCEPRWSGRV